MAFEFARSVIRSPMAYLKNWRGLASTRREMLKYKKENPACEGCGRTKGVEVHHIEPVSVNPERADDPDNLISLGRPCR